MWNVLFFNSLICIHFCLQLSEVNYVLTFVQKHFFSLILHWTNNHSIFQLVLLEYNKPEAPTEETNITRFKKNSATTVKKKKKLHGLSPRAN
jgi:hypothetical protein